jgi:hypothetical protein
VRPSRKNEQNQGEYDARPTPSPDTSSAALETARLEVIERLARSPDPLTGGDLQLLAMIHTALSAIREEIQAHGLGWGGDDTLE